MLNSSIEKSRALNGTYSKPEVANPPKKEPKDVALVSQMIEIFQKLLDTNPIVNSKYNMIEIVNEFIDSLTEYKYILTSEQ